MLIRIQWHWLWMHQTKPHLSVDNNKNHFLFFIRTPPTPSLSHVRLSVSEYFRVQELASYGVIGSCDHPDMGAKNRTPFLRRNSMHILIIDPSLWSPSTYFYRVFNLFIKLLHLKPYKRTIHHSVLFHASWGGVKFTQSHEESPILNKELTLHVWSGWCFKTSCRHLHYYLKWRNSPCFVDVTTCFMVYFIYFFLLFSVCLFQNMLPH